MGLTLYMWLIIIRALISWVNPDPYNPIVRFLYRVTEPVLYQVRKWIPLRGMGMDFFSDYCNPGDCIPTEFPRKNHAADCV